MGFIVATWHNHVEHTPMSPSPTEFSASYDRTTKIMSVAVCVLLVVVSLASHNAIASSFSVLVVALGYAYSPRGYAISVRTIIVRRLIGNVRIPLESIREARRVTKDDLCRSIRVWGSGGMFGYYGLFRTSKLGMCWWYLTNRQDVVVVITESKRALFSPDNVDGFLSAIQAEAPAYKLADAGESIGPCYESRFSIGKWIGITVGVLAVGVVAFAFLYSPGPPNYTLTADELTIHDRFYPVTLKAAEVDVTRTRVVDIRTDTDWKPASRTNGFSNSHYHSGWFRVANGQKVRMYRADGTRLALLPPKGNGSAVLLEVKAPEEFVEELQRRW
ncbi:MAG: PH domain-containing protein [Bryobacteraceae bacterium]